MEPVLNLGEKLHVGQEKLLSIGFKSHIQNLDLFFISKSISLKDSGDNFLIC